MAGIGSDEIDQAYTEAEFALLQAIKKNCESNVGARTRDFAEAYALLTGRLKSVGHTDVTVQR